MSERIPFPMTEEMLRAERKPFRRRSFIKSSMVQLTLVRFREFIREPEAVFWTFVFPILLAAGLGIAFRQRGPDRVQIGVVTSAPGSAALIQSLTKDSSLVVATYDDSAAALALRTGKVALLVVPASAKDSVRYVYDRGRSDAVSARVLVDRAVQRGAGRIDPVRVSDSYVTEAGSRYIDFLIPGLLGMNLMNSGMWGIGFALVDMRQRKLLKRFVGTPMRRGDFLLALLSSRLVLMLIEIGLLLTLGVVVFHMKVMGTLFSIVLLGSAGAVAFGGIGLLTASRAQKIESVSGLMNLVMMPMWIFSGVFFSYERFPAMIQPLIKALPLTALNDALRASILEGQPLSHQWPRLLVLTLWGGLSFALAVRWFRWT
jgi:ABC-type multidrug transport system permease subunit